MPHNPQEADILQVKQLGRDLAEFNAYRLGALIALTKERPRVNTIRTSPGLRTYTTSTGRYVRLDRPKPIRPDIFDLPRSSFFHLPRGWLSDITVPADIAHSGEPLSLALMTDGQITQWNPDERFLGSRGTIPIEEEVTDEGIPLERRQALVHLAQACVENLVQKHRVERYFVSLNPTYSS